MMMKLMVVMTMKMMIMTATTTTTMVMYKRICASKRRTWSVGHGEMARRCTDLNRCQEAGVVKVRVGVNFGPTLTSL